MILDRIIKDCGTISTVGSTAVEISAVCNDSRKVVPGALFIAVKGYAIDGHTFIRTAVEKGAAAIIYEDQEILEAQTQGVEGITFVKVESSRYALAIAAANFYDNPSRKLTLVGITGTNGSHRGKFILENISQIFLLF